MTTKKRRKATRKSTRKAGIPCQVYLTKADARAIVAIAKARKVSISDLVRRWIERARPKKKAPAKTDARQLALIEGGGAS
jgi:Holliday junction resolvasome RuvABC endonuclease subunit